MKRGWMFSKKVTLLHQNERTCIYRQSDGTLYAVVVAERLNFTGPFFELYKKFAGNL